MKAVSWLILASGIVLSTILPSVVTADILRVAPLRTLILPNDEAELTRVVFQFDLSGMRQGEGLEISEAILDWTISGVTSGLQSDFSIHEITESWDMATLDAGGDSPTYREAPTDSWSLHSQDLQRIGHFLRFDLTALTDAWRINPSRNFGVVIVTRDVSRVHLTSIVQDARLVIRYGFYASRPQP